ncbi:hypothetical protein BGZ63DRAFT_399033 [Mariannaea sp. PMI_226]|nr:hypothetical protein BGZ63DRAFT_399033 [Mariannaea sp. PMI_226]
MDTFGPLAHATKLPLQAMIWTSGLKQVEFQIPPSRLLRLPQVLSNEEKEQACDPGQASTRGKVRYLPMGKGDTPHAGRETRDDTIEDAKCLSLGPDSGAIFTSWPSRLTVDAAVANRSTSPYNLNLEEPMKAVVLASASRILVSSRRPHAFSCPQSPLSSMHQAL